MSAIIPGSEVFSTKVPTPEELRAQIGDSLDLHEVTQERVDAVDPLTYEVVRHRLWSVTNEMGEALKKMSGSLVVSDTNDFNFALTDELGQSMQLGLYNTELSACADMAITWTLQHRADNPGIEAGDMFLCNDPWVGGGSHQNDVCIFAPLFWEGKLFCWSAAVAHQLDLGGVAPGSWTPRSQDVFWESLPTPPMKIVRDGTLQRDAEDVYLRRSRIPQLVGLDLRAKIGANSVAQNRLEDLLRQYGAESVKAVMKRMMDDAERRLRAKLRAIPDGSWTGTSYQEQSHADDRGLHKITVKLTKSDDAMTLDFTGTDPQSGMINCTYVGLRGGVMAAVLPMLASDMPWALGGIQRCIEVISEEGTLNNATFPAGVCKASIASSWATSNAVLEAISKMLDVSDTHRHTGQAVGCGTWDVGILAGVDQHDAPFVYMVNEAMAGGMGAGFARDGVDTGGQIAVPQGRIADVEMTELMTPVLYLWRREEPNSGGAGKYRGGLSGSICLVPWDTSAPMSCVVSGSGKAVSMNVGLAGGYPGNHQQDIIVRDTNVRDQLAAGRLPALLADVTGTEDTLGNEVETVLDQSDLYMVFWQGGGGYGDPLLREPELVLSDLLEGKVTIAAANDIYGVVVDAEARAVDVGATEKRREEIRDVRRKRIEEQAEVTA